MLNSKLLAEIEQNMRNWRRRFHKFSEPGWCEFATASFVITKLKKWGFEVHYGKELLSHGKRNGLPEKESMNFFYEKAKKQADLSTNIIEELQGGFTAVAGIIGNDKGPTILIRVDMDALALQETSDKTHLPNKFDFSSGNDGYMHACGHDAHTAIGLGIAQYFSQTKDELKGKLIILFQPAEEGLRGAGALINHPIFSNIQYGIGMHLWADEASGKINCGTNGQLASYKFDIELEGKAAHAGLNPELGINAMIPAAKIVLAVEKLREKHKKAAKINIGVMQAGTGRNIVCPSAKLFLETRANNDEANHQLYQSCINLAKEIAAEHACKIKIIEQAYAPTANSNLSLSTEIHALATKDEFFTELVLQEEARGNSEDFTSFMKHIQNKGGLAVHLGIGASIYAGAHHTSNFDINEDTMLPSLRLVCSFIEKKLID